MKEITRFDMDMDGSMEPSEHGEWVRYEDAQRTWVGLTDEEIDKLRSGYQSGRIGSFVALAQAIEAKLKELNT